MRDTKARSVKCEFSSKCRFCEEYISKMPLTVGVYKGMYCNHDFVKCARYMVASDLGYELVPHELYPTHDIQARKIIAENEAHVKPQRRCTMTLEVRYAERPGYLLVRVCGKWEELDAKEEIEALREEAEKRGITRLFLDVRDMLPPESLMTRTATGGYIAKLLTPPFRVVALAEPEMIDGITEYSAVSQGAIFKVFADEKAAIEWLHDRTTTIIE